MKAKAAVSWLVRFSALVVTGMVDTIIAAMTDNIHFTTPSPTLVAVTEANEATKAAIANAANGDRAQIAVRNMMMANLLDLVRPLAYYVTVTSAGDVTKLLSSGFPMQKTTRDPIGPLPTPATPLVSPGHLHGMLGANTGAVRGARIYNWRIALASAPTVHVQQLQTTAAYVDFVDLIRGGIYNIQVNAVGTAGATEWGDVANITAP